MLKHLVFFAVMIATLPQIVLASPMSKQEVIRYIEHHEKSDASLAHCAEVSAVEMMHLLCFVTETGKMELCESIKSWVEDDAHKEAVLDLTYTCLRAGVLRNATLSDTACEMLDDDEFPHFKAHCKALMQGSIEGCHAIGELKERTAAAPNQNERDVVECLLHHAQRLNDYAFCVAANQFFETTQHPRALEVDKAFLEQCPASYVDFWKTPRHPAVQKKDKE